MDNIIPFPDGKLRKSEIAEISHLVQKAVSAHSALEEYAAAIAMDTRLKSIRDELIVDTLSHLLKDLRAPETNSEE